MFIDDRIHSEFLRRAPALRSVGASLGARQSPAFHLAILTSLVLLFSGPSNVSAQTIREDLYVTDGQVNACVLAGNTLYIGGIFTTVGPPTGSWVPIDAATGLAASGFPRVDGPIRAMASDGAGGWFLGGEFTHVGGIRRLALAHVGSDNTVTSWNPAVSGWVVHALAVDGSTVYVGGEFGQVDGQPRNNIAAVDAISGHVTDWDPMANDVVRTLVVDGAVVYAGGDFTTVGGLARNRIAAIDAATGGLTTWDPNADGRVSSIVMDGGTVYAGGLFTNIGGQARNYIAALDAAAGSASPWNPDADGDVVALAVEGSMVYAGGAFEHIGGQVRSFIAAVSVSTGNATSWNPGALGTVNTLLVDGATVYAGGFFTSIGGQPRNRIAAIDAATGMATAWNPDANGSVSTLAMDGSTVCAGGSFSSIGGQERNSIAALDVTTGSLTAWNPDISGWAPEDHPEVDALTVDGSTVYVGGVFSAISGQPRNNIAAIDAATGTATPWNPDAHGIVTTLLVDGSTVYAGGHFTSIGGQPRNRIAAIDAATGMATWWNPDADGVVTALAAEGATVYAGGYFGSIGGQPRHYIAALDANTGMAMAWNPDADGVVEALAVEGATVYAGGSFWTIGGQHRFGIAALDATTGTATAWVSGANDGYVFALAVDGATVYAGGNFWYFGGQPRPGIAAIDASTGLVSTWEPFSWYTMLPIVHDLAVDASTVYAGGQFTSINGLPQHNIVGISKDSPLPEPLAIIDLDGGAKAMGRILTLVPGGVWERDTTIFINDSLTTFTSLRPPTDTIPSNARIEFRWHADPAPGSYIVRYEYKLDEPDFVVTDWSVQTATYNTGLGGDRITPGTKVFTLRAIDNRGQVGETTRRFQMNFDPDTWFAGPAPWMPIYQANERGEIYYEVTDWNALPGLPGSLLSCDSLQTWPAERPHRKTFFEIYENRIYVRSEDDTVHMNSWVILHNGGADHDSPYDVVVSSLDPALEDTLVCGPSKALRPGRPNGSPIGFHHRFETLLTPTGPATIPALSGLYPVFDPASIFRLPRIGGYGAMTQAGRVYALVRAEDGDGATDTRLARARELVDRVARGEGTPEDIGLRTRILTFYVDYPPLLQTEDPAFVPGIGDTFPSRSLQLNLLAGDADPYDPASPPATPGGPSSTSILRYRLTVHGKNPAGRDTTFEVPGIHSPSYTFNEPAITVELPDYIIERDIQIQVELCDCADCEGEPGSGRCGGYAFPVVVPAADTPTPTLISLVDAKEEAGVIRLTWLAARGGGLDWRLYRSVDAVTWELLSPVSVSATGYMEYLDRDVQSGHRYGYRLGLGPRGEGRFFEEVWVELPLFRLAIDGARFKSNGFEIAFQLPTAGEVITALMDVAGRRVAECRLGRLAAGSHAATLGTEGLPSGIYFVTLKHGGAGVVRKTLLLR